MGIPQTKIRISMAKEIILGKDLGTFRVAQSGEKYGIDQLRKLVLFAGEVEDDIFRIAEDGKVKFFEVIGFFFQNVKGAVDIAQHAKEIKNQFLDLSDVEILELAPVIEEAFEVEEGKAQDAIEEFVVPFWSFIELGFEHLERIKARKKAA